MHVVEITGSIKGMPTFTLGQRTLIVGPNGSGKSAILQAVALALTGEADDVAGREVVARGDFIEALSNGPLTVVATLSDGSVCTYGGSKGRARFPEAWMWRQLREELTGGPAKARQFVLRAAGVGDVWATHLTVQEAVKTAKATIKLTQEEIARIAPGEIPTDASIERLAIEVDSARARYGQEAAIQAAISATNELILLSPKVDKFEAWLRANPAAQTAVDRARLGESILLGVDAVLDMADREKRSTLACVMCGAHDVPVAQIKTRRATMHERIEAAQASVGDLAKYQATLRRVEELKRIIRSTGDRNEDIVELPEGLTSEKWLEQATATHLMATEARKAGKQAGRLNADLGAAQTELRAAEVREAISKAAVETALQIALPAFEARVTGFLPAGWLFGLTIDNQAARIGLRRQGRLDIAVSGAEWITVMLAIGCAISGGDGLRIFAPEDRGWDSATLTSVLRATADAPTQILLTSTVPPLEQVEGWTVIRLGALEATETDWGSFLAGAYANAEDLVLE